MTNKKLISGKTKHPVGGAKIRRIGKDSKIQMKYVSACSASLAVIFIYGLLNHSSAIL